MFPTVPRQVPITPIAPSLTSSIELKPVALLLLLFSLLNTEKVSRICHGSQYSHEKSLPSLSLLPFGSPLNFSKLG